MADKKKAEAPIVDETTRTSLDPKHAPVSFPPGSFDVDALQEALEPATKAKVGDRDAEVSKALEATNESVTDRTDQSAMPGYKLVEAPHDSIEGLTETTRAFDRKAAEAAEEEQAAIEEARSGDADTSVAGSASASGGEQAGQGK